MDPTGAGRLRGFRAPGADEVASRQTTAAPAASAGQAPGDVDVIDTTPEASAAPRRTASWRWLVLAGAVLVVAIAVIAALAFRLGTSSAASEASSPSPTPTPAPTATPLAVPDLYTRLVPSVVLVTTSKGSLGSGTVVTDTGTILTANHVISGGGDLTVLFADGTKAKAEIASTNPKQDTATLEPQKLPEVVVPAALGGGVQVGADVVAMGNPLGQIGRAHV